MNDSGAIFRALDVRRRLLCALLMWQDAWGELEALEPEERAHPYVLLSRLGIFVGMERCESAAALAESLVAKGLRSDSCFMLGADAIRRLRSIEEVKAFLLRGEREMEASPAFQLKLAGYGAHLGNLAEAKHRVAVAIGLEPSSKLAALKEPDLAPLWDSMAGTL